MSQILPRLAALLVLSILAACGPKTTPNAPPPSEVPGYEGVQDGAFFVPGIEPRFLQDGNSRQEVSYTAGDAPGTIVVDVYSRKLYLVQDGGRAIRYGIAVGREGTSFRGDGYIGRKAEWPSWRPTDNMIRTQPETYAHFAAGLPGGLENPLGSRALYLYRGGRDTMFRIHGTIDPSSIGRATSAGCIRLFNQDVMDLYTRVGPGAHVKVRTLEESIAIEGPMMDDAYGRAVPATPENAERKARELKQKSEREARAAQDAAKARAEAQKAAEKAERQRLRQCRNKRIAPEDCLPSSAS